MKIKRLLFIGSLIVLFGICFTIMNKHYDELARYPYATKDNREIIVKYLSTDDINYMIAQQLEPEQFLPYIEIENFDIHNTVWYGRAKELQDASNKEIVSFMNDFRTRLEYSSLESTLTNYSYSTLCSFFEKENEYVKNAKLTSNPAGMYTLVQNQESLYTYVPKDLVAIGDIPHVSLVDNRDVILVKSEVLKPLQELCGALQDVNQKTCGNLILTAGYISYEEQIPLYEKMMLKYGTDKFREVWDYPGQNEFQLGYSVRFQFAGKEDNNIDEFTLGEQVRKKDTTSENEAILLEEEQLITWMEENSYLYGFTLRYPKDKDSYTGKKHQPFTLRYVGKDIAKQLFESKKSLEEFTFHVK